VLHRVTAEVQDGTRVETAYDANRNPASLTYPSGKRKRDGEKKRGRVDYY